MPDKFRGRLPGDWSLQQADIRMRDELLQRAIQMAGVIDPETARHFEGAEFTSFLQKPFQFEVLRAELARMLKAEAPWGESGRK